MIHSKKELEFYNKADLMMNRGVFHYSFIRKIINLVDPDYTIQYLRIYRKLQYLSQQTGFFNRAVSRLYLVRKNRLGAKIGFYIGGDYGYGLVIPHYGCVVAGGTVGNYAVLHSSICLTGNVRTIGDFLYVSTGAKIVGEVDLGDSITVAPNAVVCKNRKGNNLFLDGSPAEIKREKYPSWPMRDGLIERVNKVEALKQQMGL